MAKKAESRRTGGAKRGAKAASPAPADRMRPSGAGGEARRPRRRWVSVLRCFTIALIWTSLAVGAVVAWYAWDLPDLENLRTPSRRPSVTLTAPDGSVLATYGDLHGGAVRFDEVPPYLVQAIVATEDRRFFDHVGVDAFGIARAAFANLRARAVRQGGSTLTQQLAKNLFLTPERSLKRKIQELLLAFWLEARFTKKQIFTIYLNRVYLGAGTYGVAAAARLYFDRSPRALGLRQAAVIAGLLKAPSRYSPLRDPDAALARADQVLANMVAAGFLGKADAAAARRARPGFAARRAGFSARYFADWLLERAAGFVGHTDRDLVIRTTLSPALQRIGERRLEAALKAAAPRRAANQGALVALAPDGAIRAMVGGRDYGESQFNRATQALRQPGSAFKLFVYLAGLEAGLTPDTAVIDAPVTIDGWSPRNYDGKYMGRVALREALAQSRNTAAVRVSERVGRNRVVAVAERLGITAPMKAHPSVALGVSEVSLLELTSAYAVLANGGYPAWPYGIVDIRDGDGLLLYRRSGDSAGRLIEPGTVASMQSMLQEVVTSGTGKAARLGRPVAGKTGTSQDFRDAWFIGFTAELATGVWVGNDNSAPMKGVTGGGLPARIWHDFMADALNGVPVSRLRVD